MSYLVLARKWRPKRFAELVGQEHVVRALGNALGTGKVHHAYLFTGTRGVGKTTIARIFAKSLNCEAGTSAEPCGQCEVCKAIDAGRFIDLLEIDAASNTGVDDVRELIDNAQYMPSRGRVKVYLIDEVHMLSKSAFNALLKTLEEPPEHVKFLLATTDPQKLPVTVLSRCLQFNLKRLDEAQIAGQIRMILGEEGIAADEGAIRQLSKAADGSLRDGLSLLDQAIAYAGGKLDDAVVTTMLGTVDRTRVAALLQALADADGARLLNEIAQLAELSPDWGSVLEALADALHRVQVKQLVPAVDVEADGIDVDAMAVAVRPELVQLWYQMAIDGRRDLPLAPSPRAGFEMALLRMLAFRPVQAQASAAMPAHPASAPSIVSASINGPAAARAALATSAAPSRAVAPSTPAVSASTASATSMPRPASQAHASVDVAGAPAASDANVSASESSSASNIDPIDAERWLQLIANSGLRGPARQLAEHSGFVAHEGNVLQLSLSPSDEHLKAPALIKMLAEALAPQLGAAPQIRYQLAPMAASGETLHQRSARQRDARQTEAEQAFLQDPDVQRLIQRGATVVPDSIRPLDDN